MPKLSVMSTVKLFSRVAVLEAISYILLLGIAMPLKYMYEKPLAVKYVGWAHGVLFMAYVVLLISCWIKFRWSFLKVTLYFLASLLPFLPFFVERDLRKNTP
jgi:integral membrane protein